MTLPLRFGTGLSSIPADLPYLSAAPDRLARWRGHLAGNGLKVALVWRGNPEHKNDAARSIHDLELLAPLWSVPGVRFFSLQTGHAETQAVTVAGSQPMVLLGGAIADFADTAAIVTQVDLVICVDTAVAHLTGAVGKRCWVMLPFHGVDWRWLDGREDSPWYPGVMRLFRQHKHGAWSELIGEVTAALATWACQLLAEQAAVSANGTGCPHR